MPPGRAVLSLSLALAAWPLGACGEDPGYQLFVDLRTDLRPRFDFDAVRTRVGRDADAPERVRGIVPSDDYLAAVRVAELDGVAAGPTSIEVALLDRDGNELIARRASIEIGGHTAVTLVITSDCVDLACPGGGDDAEATECLVGRCVPPGCRTPADPDCAGYLTECLDPGDCAPTVPCARSSCVDGVCLSISDDARCGAGEYCDVRDGCRTEVAVDAGPRDAGLADAGPPDAGTTCVPADCDDGNPCTDDICMGGTTCTSSANASSCDDGVVCNGTDTCGGGTCSLHGGDPCGAGTVCDEGAGGCVGCASDTDCPAVVSGPWSTCGGFTDTCDETGEQTRMVTTYSCASTVCMPSTTTETRGCARPSTDGVVCGVTSCGAWGACGGFASGCDDSGTQTRGCMDYACASGACVAAPRSEMQSCSRTVCVPGGTRPCGTGQIETCSADCTWCSCMPDTSDPTCSGIGGAWSGCRGTGCDVCDELVSAYPCYFSRHPSCRSNSACASSYYPCNVKCPPPTEADTCMCATFGGGWSGCSGSGCQVCTSAVSAYACYFINHPECTSRASCATMTTCNALCPAPTAADRGTAM